MKLIGRDFRPFTEITLDTDNLGPGLIAVVGDNRVSDYADSNAVGKTSLMQLVIWTLFGECPGVSAAGKLVRRGTRRGSKAYGEIKIPGLHITRTRSKTKHEVQVSFNDGPWQSWDVDVARQKIELHLGVTYRQFCDLFFFTGEFRVATKTDAPLKALLSSLIPVDVTPAGPKANATRQAAREALAVSERLLADAINRQATIGQKLTEAQRQHNLWVESTQSRIQMAQAAILETTTALQTAQEQIDAWNAILAAAGDAAGAAERVSAIRFEWTNALTSRTNAERRIGELTRSLETEFIPGNCPTCQQALPAAKQQEARARHEAQHEREREELQNLYLRVTELNTQITAKEPQLRKLEAALAAANTTQIEEAKQGVLDWQRVLGGHQDRLRAAERARDIEQGATSPYAALVKSIEQEASDLEKSRHEHETAIPGLRQTVEHATYVADLVAKTGLPHFAVEQLLPALSSYASVYLSALSAQHMTVAFQGQTERGSDKLHIAAASTSGGETYADMSDGEQRRIDVAAFLALHKLANQVLGRIPILIADELLDRSTDATAKSMMLPLLRDYAVQEGCQVLVITNDKGVIADRRQFLRVLMVTKTTDGSIAKEL